MPHSSGDTVFDGAFFGLTVADAAKKALGLKRKPLHSSDLVPLLRQGGIVMNSADPSNTVNSILSRRFNDVGDIVRVERSTWGLREWYPHTNFGRKKDPTSKDVVEQASAPAVQPTDEV
jgi:DNA-directed RNA polymerase delta subunit